MENSVSQKKKKKKENFKRYKYHLLLIVGIYTYYWAFQVALVVEKKNKKKKHLHCWRQKRHGFNPWVRKIPWRRAWQPTPVLLPGESPWAEEPGRLQSIGLQRIRQDWSDLAHAQCICQSQSPNSSPDSSTLASVCCSLRLCLCLCLAKGYSLDLGSRRARASGQEVDVGEIDHGVPF